jgi:hypothetical protein
MNERPENHMEVNMKATRDKQGFLRNLVTNVKGPSVSVVLIAWLSAVVIIAIKGDNHTGAIGLLSAFIGTYLVILTIRSN